jgi:hypothetical protein
VEYRNEVAPTCKEGYSGDLYCKDCGAMVEKGLVYPPNGAHEFESDMGKLICMNCGYEDSTHNANSSESDGWIIVACVCVPVGLIALTVVAVILIKKRKG